MSDSTISTSTNVKRRSGSAVSLIATIVAVVLVVAAVILLLQNTVHTTINFLGWNADIGQGVALLAAGVVGALIAISISTILRIRRALR